MAALAGVKQGRGEPEGHDRGQGRSGGEEGRHQRDDFARAERGEAACQSGEENRRDRAALQGRSDDVLQPAGGGIGDEENGESDVGGGGEERSGDLQEDGEESLGPLEGKKDKQGEEDGCDFVPSQEAEQAGGQAQTGGGPLLAPPQQAPPPLPSRPSWCRFLSHLFCAARGIGAALGDEIVREGAHARIVRAAAQFAPLGASERRARRRPAGAGGGRGWKPGRPSAPESRQRQGRHPRPRTRARRIWSLASEPRAAKAAAAAAVSNPLCRAGAAGAACPAPFRPRAGAGEAAVPPAPGIRPARCLCFCPLSHGARSGGAQLRSARAPGAAALAFGAATFGPAVRAAIAAGALRAASRPLLGLRGVVLLGLLGHGDSCLSLRCLCSVVSRSLSPRTGRGGKRLFVISRNIESWGELQPPLGKRGAKKFRPPYASLFPVFSGPCPPPSLSPAAGPPPSPPRPLGPLLGPGDGGGEEGVAVGVLGQGRTCPAELLGPPRPVGTVAEEEGPLGVGHEGEDAACGIQEAGGIVLGAGRVGGVGTARCGHGRRVSGASVSGASFSGVAEGGLPGGQDLAPCLLLANEAPLAVGHGQTQDGRQVSEPRALRSNALPGRQEGAPSAPRRARSHWPRERGEAPPPPPHRLCREQGRGGARPAPHCTPRAGAGPKRRSLQVLRASLPAGGRARSPHQCRRRKKSRRAGRRSQPRQEPPAGRAQSREPGRAGLPPPPLQRRGRFRPRS